MAAGVNKVILIGNLGKDPEVRYTQGGMAVCTLRLAVTERRKEGDGWKDHTEWMDVSTFGKTAENAGQYLQKGRQVYVEGRLQTRTWKDKETGADRYKTEVVANTLQFLGGGGGERGAPAPRRDAGASRPAGGGGGDAMDDGPPPDAGFVDDDLPF